MKTHCETDPTPTYALEREHMAEMLSVEDCIPSSDNITKTIQYMNRTNQIVNILPYNLDKLGLHKTWTVPEKIKKKLQEKLKEAGFPQTEENVSLLYETLTELYPETEIYGTVMLETHWNKERGYGLMEKIINDAAGLL